MIPLSLFVRTSDMRSSQIPFQLACVLFQYGGGRLLDLYHYSPSLQVESGSEVGRTADGRLVAEHPDTGTRRLEVNLIVKLVRDCNSH